MRVLYEQISEGKLELDRSLQETIQTVQAKLRTMQQEALLLMSKQQLPFKKFGEGQLDSFVDAARNALLSGEQPKAKAFLRALVTEIRVEATRCRVRGSKALMASTVSRWDKGTPDGVPRLVSDWCGWQESNPRPLGS